MTFQYIENKVEELEKRTEALEQEHCDDEYIKVPKKALKYRTAGMVAYNVEWLKNHFDIERAAIFGVQEPCEDCINREETLKALMDEWTEFDSEIIDSLVEKIKKLPPVTLAEKVGHWIEDGEDIWKCSRCHELSCCKANFCPDCGAKMEEVEE